MYPISLFPSSAGWFPRDSLLLELRADEILEGKDLVPFFLRQQLAFPDHDLVQRFSGYVALPCDLRALLVAEGGLQYRHDAE